MCLSLEFTTEMPKVGTPCIRVADRNHPNEIYAIPINSDIKTWGEFQNTLAKIFPHNNAPFSVYEPEGDIIHSSLWSAFVKRNALFHIASQAPQEGRRRLRLTFQDTEGQNEVCLKVCRKTKMSTLAKSIAAERKMHRVKLQFKDLVLHPRAKVLDISLADGDKLVYKPA